MASRRLGGRINLWSNRPCSLIFPRPKKVLHYKSQYVRLLSYLHLSVILISELCLQTRRRIMKIAESTSVLYFSEGLTMIEEKETIGSGCWTWKRVFTITPGVIGHILPILEKNGPAWADTHYHSENIKKLNVNRK